MELLILGLALGVGAAKRKEVTKAVVKGYMTISEKTREVTAHLKEDMRDAVEEARYEQDLLVSEAPAAEMDTSTERVVLHEEAAAADAVHVTAASVAAASVEAGRKVQTGLFKGLAKSYLAMTEKTRSTVAQMREEMRDAVEEARFEREHDTAKAETVVTADPIPDSSVSEHMHAPIVTVAPAGDTVPETPPAKRRGRPAGKQTVLVAPAGDTVPEATPAKRRGRPAGKKAVVEIVAVKAPRRLKPKTTKSAEPETPTERSERIETAIEAAEIATAVL